MATLLLVSGAIALGAGLGMTLLGFGTAGIAAGSVAAGIQACIGNVTAGSLFATLTSLGMQGVFTIMAAGGTAASGLGATLLTLF